VTLPPRIRDRPTPDLIVLALTGVVILVLVFTTITLLVEAIWYPDHGEAEVAKRIGQILSSLVAAIVGYLAGRGVNGRKEE
jgi:Na+/H+ antiporter NhaA